MSSRGDARLEIRRLHLADLASADAVLRTAFGGGEGWGSEVARLLGVQPEGWFGAVLDGRLVGMAGATNYGDFAWIGLMGVDPSMQRRGIGRAILERVVQWTEEQGCSVAVLDASAAGERLYRSFGFVDHGSTVLFQWDGRGKSPATFPPVAPIQAPDLPEIWGFDRPIFDADRSHVLAALFDEEVERGYLSRDASGRIDGYLFLQPDRIGPWIAKSAATAESLLSAALAGSAGRPLTVRVPGGNAAAVPILGRYGFGVKRSLSHMYLGPSAPAQRLDAIYSEASFACG